MCTDGSMIDVRANGLDEVHLQNGENKCYAARLWEQPTLRQFGTKSTNKSKNCDRAHHNAEHNNVDKISDGFAVEFR